MHSSIQGFALVRCGDEIHRISVKEGQIILYDHPDAKTNMVSAVITNEMPYCVKLFNMWRLGHLTSDVPSGLHSAFATRIAKTRERRSAILSKGGG